VNLDRIVHRCYQGLARRRGIVRTVVRVRNQLDHIVRYGFVESYDLSANGELALLKAVGPRVRRFVDVGANVGQWSSLAFATFPASAEGVLLEPSTAAMAQLTRLFAGEPRCHLVPAAAGDVPGRLTFYEEADCGETSTLLKAAHKPGATEREVTVTTVDAELDVRGWDHADMLKIDAEGYDLQVLRGASRALGEQRIGLVQFEYNHAWMFAGATLAMGVRLLNDFGYEVYLLRSDGLYTLNYRRYGEWFAYANFVAVGPTMADVVRPMCRGSFD
jgi:FkbM family methyltransferase